MKKIIAVSVFVLLSWPAIAQSVGERIGVNTAIGIAPKTPNFVKEAATSDMFEIESSKLANSRTSGEVKAFAGKMVADHTQTSEELKAKAQAANVPVPTAMDDKHQKMLDKLRGLTVRISLGNMSRTRSADTRMRCRCSSAIAAVATTRA